MSTAVAFDKAYSENAPAMSEGGQPAMAPAVSEAYVARPLALRSVRGVRDLGGYAYVSESGARGTTATGVFLRGGSLCGISRTDVRALRSYGVTGVVDLRSPLELRFFRDPFSQGRCRGVSYASIPMLDQLVPNGLHGVLPERMSDVYRDLLDDDAASINRVFKALDNGGCTLFHCRAGKDRTGVIAMLLLKLAGVSDEAVVADYAVSGDYMGRALGAQRAGLSVLLRRSVPRCLFESAPDEMERTLAHLYERYGSAYDYLHDVAGVSAAALARITARLQGHIA